MVMVKYMFIRRILAALLVSVALQTGAKEPAKNVSPLAKYSAEWNGPKYSACNTAANTTYLSAREKEIIYVLNLARMDPKLFCKTVLPYASEISSFIDTANTVYYKTLVKEMLEMAPLKLLKPDEKCYASAQCHAASTGKTGYVGHDRKTPECRNKQYYSGECCQYGVSDPLGIILNLLVDENVQSLGHRRICLGSYEVLAPSCQPHKAYGTVAVLDFH